MQSMSYDPHISRRRMVETIARQGVRDQRVLAVMNQIPRHLFAPELPPGQAYANEAFFIGSGQTISQPLIVGLMVQALMLGGQEKVLEVGTGSGYQTAILARLCDWVYSIERLLELYNRPLDLLAKLQIYNTSLRRGDGSLGWPEEAPFDAIIVAAGAPQVPAPLLEQLAEGGRLVIPVGRGQSQTLLRITRAMGQYRREELESCRFVPLVGRHGWNNQ
jgi:protein-L-isoaspartate(D-aspartate) O-methyltransferase